MRQEAIEQMFCKNTLSIISQFLHQTKQPITVSLLTFQQRVWSRIDTLSDTPKFKQDLTLIHIDPNRKLVE